MISRRRFFVLIGMFASILIACADDEIKPDQRFVDVETNLGPFASSSSPTLRLVRWTTSSGTSTRATTKGRSSIA